MRRAVYVVSVVWVAVVSACGGATGHDTAEATHVLDLIEQGVSPGASGGVTSPSIGRPTVAVLATAGVPPFDVLARTTQLQKAPCANCHTLPIAAMRWSGEDGRKRAHWAIELAHAPASVMTCATCHSPDRLGKLRTLAGAAVEFDHAYQVCAQCHSTQAADWVGGAHGTRASGWAPPRVVYSCTECHNPHQPALATRWPARAGGGVR
jgi:hypothetical protein